MKKIFKYIIGGIVITSLLSTAKKVNDLIDISSKLQYRLSGLPKVLSFSKYSFNIKIINPTKYYLNAQNFSIKNIKIFTEDNKDRIAYSNKIIENIEIPPNSEIIVSDIEFKVTLNLFQAIKLLKNLNKIEKLKVHADVLAFGHKILEI